MLDLQECECAIEDAHTLASAAEIAVEDDATEGGDFGLGLALAAASQAKSLAVIACLLLLLQRTQGAVSGFEGIER